jgi:hypothetical protein
MSIRSSASVRPFRKPVLDALSPEDRRFYDNNDRHLPASSRTISDYVYVVRHRPLTGIEKQDLNCAIQTLSKKSDLYRGRAIQAGIECGVYALKTLVHRGA